MTNELTRVDTGGGTLSVRVIGHGPLVVLIHGWPELGLSWRHQARPLADAGFTVAVPDMRGFGGSFKPSDVSAYNTDALADDVASIVDHVGARRWIAVGHDHGSPVAWRCALRFPDRVAGVFSLSVPHSAPMPGLELFEQVYPDTFFYIRYFQQVGPPEAELETDVRRALKQIFHSLSGDAPEREWIKPRPRDSRLLDGLTQPAPGPLTFMPDDVLDQYADAFRAGGFAGPISWYRNIESNATQAAVHGTGVITQPAGFLCGDKEVVLAMNPGSLLRQRELVPNLLVETVLPGAGHWIQQERPEEVTTALVRFAQLVFGQTS